MRFSRKAEEAPRKKTAGFRGESSEGGRREHVPGWRRHLPEVLILLLSLVALAVVGPLRDVLAPLPAVLFVGALWLFMVPGFVLSLALLGSDLLSGPARIPVAFVLSTGVFGLAALPELVSNGSIAFYPIICGSILALSLGLAVARIVRKQTTTGSGEGRPGTSLSTVLLWVPFLLPTGVLAWVSAANVPRPAEDIWVYLSRMRNLFESGLLGGGSSRLAVNGWLPEQAMLSRVSGLEPVDLVLRYLAPTLVVVALLALYALARTLLQSEKAALVIGSLSALFFLVALGSPSFGSVLAPAGELVEHITEDKYVARYAFLPVALSLAIIFMRERNRRNLGLFFFVCLSAAVVHPLGLVFIGIPVAGFGLLHLAIKRRDRGAWRGVVGLWIALLVLIGPPALYLLATGNPLLSKLDAQDEGVAATQIGTWQYEQRLLDVGEGSYVVHPSLLLDPAMLAVYLLGVPFLIWKIKQARNSLAAQLLLGTLAFTPVLIFVPYVATFISGIVGPWLLYRLVWSLLLAALLTLGWMCWEALRFATSGSERLGLSRSTALFVPTLVAVLLLINATPAALTALRAADDPAKTGQGESTCLDPTFRWVRDALPASAGLMAPRAENSCVRAYAPSVDVLGARGQAAAGARQVPEEFYNAPTIGPDALEILERRERGYVMLPANSPLVAQLEYLPGFARMDNPGERYRMYEVVDRQRAFEPTPTVVANGSLNDENWDAAIEAYTEALEGDPGDDERFLAYLGLGRAYTEKEQPAEAAESYEAAIKLDPESPAAHELLAGAYNVAGEKDRARSEFERAVELDPGNVDLRLRYGRFLVPLDRREAVEQHRAVVDAYPMVPDYRVNYGAALLLAGAPEAGDEQFERAASLTLPSAVLEAEMGRANQAAGRPEEALQHYEEALEREPNSQLYALQLGKVHAQLSTRDGYDEGHFEEAEELLASVEDRGHLPWEKDRREAARIALGDLYAGWDRPEDAAAAYEEALELNPESEEAQSKLDGLRQ